MRCLLFSSDEGTAQSICQVLADLGIEAESCSEAVAAVERVTNQGFQIVVIDWDKQPEAGFLLNTTRERKPAERPLTLAVVSDDASVPKALQAGANSILRKPILVNQVKDTLKTARDLLRARQDAATAAQAAAAGVGSGGVTSLPGADAGEPTLRAGEFLQSAPTTPGGQFVTDSDVQESQQPSQEVDPLKDLEPVAAAVPEQPPVQAAPPEEPRTLEWYLKKRAGVAQAQALAYSAAAAAPAPSAKPELLGYDETPSHSASQSSASARSDAMPGAPEAASDQGQEQRKEAELFAYIAGEREQPREEREPRFRLGKKAIVGALVLASCAVLAAPQAPWRPAMKGMWARGQQALHAWLNPQPVTPPQAPESHENFGRPGDEYKLPVAENIPDATTDPSQIQVVPVMDPTAKRPNSLGGNAEQGATPVDGTTATSGDQAPPTGAPVQGNQPVAAAPQTAQPASGAVAGGVAPAPAVAAPVSTSPSPAPATQPSGTASAVFPTATPTVTQPSAPKDTQPHSVAPSANVPSSLKTQMASMTPDGSGNKPATPKDTQPYYALPAANVPSSLKSQMASMTPDAGGNKAPETALPSIEPVDVPESAERALATDQPAIAYPASATGQQGTVVLQVLIGRDGTVQDAKFLQGSLAFARAAIDGVKQWKFKPYMMNGRPVSVQTKLTMGFKPAS